MKKVKSKKSNSLTRYESREFREIKEWKAKEPSVMDKALGIVVEVLSAAGANRMEEKLGALLAIRSIQQALVKQTWKKMAETAAKTQMSKEGAIIALRNLAKQLSINITKRKALAAIPWIGSLV